MRKRSSRSVAGGVTVLVPVCVLVCLLTAPRPLGAQSRGANVMEINASGWTEGPHPVAAALGSARSPSGHTLRVNSEYLVLDGKPWLPVMGEFHYSRYPEAEWEPEILKMKAAGVQIISTYVIWIHHEQTEGVFDWSGQRDLRHFAELCGRHGMYLYPRIGPWAHAEVRNGGLPDWVLKNGPVRQNDPVYLKEVKSFYAQIGEQLKGELWKDGGPVIGVQVENEYSARGPGKGDEHIRTLKAMAVAAGLDVPLYTVTGWDGAAIPLDAVLPVFGGYPDAPWGGTRGPMPPNEVYAFRFGNRAAGSMGAIGSAGQNDASSYEGTPFLTAEVGDGIEDTYFRRPVVDADDIAAIAPVMLGSGANLLGYYMFHGGRNPDGGGLPLEESQRTGYPTDVPQRSYDFQAPLGEFGQVRESLRKLKLVHYFLADFGEQLAPMMPHSPDRTPASPADTSVARVAARTRGQQAYVFFNNYVRGLTMPARPGFQVALKLPGHVQLVPETPLTLPSGAYGIWPVNLPVGAATLRYSTAQLFKQVPSPHGRYLFFFAIPGVPPEFVLSEAGAVTVVCGKVEQTPVASGLRLRMPGNAAAEVLLGDGTHLVLLPEAQAEAVWRTDDPTLLLQSPYMAYADGPEWTVESEGKPKFDVGVFGSSEPLAGLPPAPLPGEIFHSFRVALPPLDLHATVTAERPAGVRAPWSYGPAFAWRPKPLPMAPDDADFQKAAAWKLTLPAVPADAPVADVFLEIDYQGDVARLYRGDRLLDDNFWNGLPWSLGLRELEKASSPERSLELQVLPLPRPYPLYLERAAALRFNGGKVAVGLDSVHLIPEYRITLRAPGPPLHAPPSAAGEP